QREVAGLLGRGFGGNVVGCRPQVLQGGGRLPAGGGRVGGGPGHGGQKDRGRDGDGELDPHGGVLNSAGWTRPGERGARPSGHGPRESPVWFHWDGSAVWVVGGESFPANLKRDPRCALGIVDWDPTTGRCHHVGMRGTAEVLPLDPVMARTIFRRYFGPDEA